MRVLLIALLVAATAAFVIGGGLALLAVAVAALHVGVAAVALALARSSADPGRSLA
jgi:hypothetical protein